MKRIILVSFLVFIGFNAHAETIEIDNGRYKLITYGTRTATPVILLDSETGKTWIKKGDTWNAMPLKEAEGSTTP